MTVYADLYFLTNASMDLAALWATGALLRIPFRPARLLLGGLAGGAIAIGALLLPGGVWQLPVALFGGALLCRIAFRVRSLRQYLLSVLLFFALSMLLGGMVTAICALFGQAGILLPAGSGGSLLYPAALLLALGCRLLGKGLHRDVACRTAPVTLTLFEKRLSLEGLLDTGNLLREPFGGRAVVILSEDAALPLLPEGVTAQTLLHGQDTLPLSLRGRLRLLPASSIGGKRLLPGLLCDADIGGRALPVCLAIDPGKHRYGGMKALLPVIR